MPFPVTAPAARQTRELERLVGERTVPTLWHENYWFRRHEIVYLALGSWVAATSTGPALESEPVVRGGPVFASAWPVLEAGSGEGYGVRLLRQAGVERVVALDYDAESLAHARDSYPDDVSGRAVRTNLTALPLADSSASAITCLQVIEHLWTPGQFLAECARELRPGGRLVVSTPDRLTFSPGLGRGEKPPNPFHCREFDAAELRDLIAEHLTVTDLLGVRHGPRLRAWQAEHGENPITAQLATTPDRWPAHVIDLVRSVTASDFVLGPLITDDETKDDETRDDGTRIEPADQTNDVLDLVVLAHRANQKHE